MDTNIIFDLARINRKLMLMNPDQLSGFNRNRTQLKILHTLFDNPGISQDELAEKINLDKTTVAKAIKLLEESHMVERKKCKNDLRKFELYATGNAKEKKKEISESIEDRNRILINNISEEELKVLKIILSKIERNIDKSQNNMMVKNSKVKKELYVARLILNKPGITLEQIMLETQLNQRFIEKAIANLLAADMLIAKIDTANPLNSQYSPSETAVKKHKHILDKIKNRS